MPAETPRPPVLLVVDDETIVRRVLTRYFTQIGYEVVEACSGLEALALVRLDATAIDLILSDIVMPEMDGMDLAAQLLAGPSAPPVILMTGHLADDAVRIGDGENIVQVVRKPPNLEELGKLVRAALATRRREADPEPLRGTGR